MNMNPLRKNLGRSAILALCAFPFGVNASAADEAALLKRLQNFKQNPAQAMQQIPPKTTKGKGKPVAIFSKAQIAGRSFVAAKNKHRDALTGRSAFKSNDAPEKLVDFPEEMVTSIQAMDKKLMKGEVKTQPWSDYYWALYNGQLAFRYADTKFPADSEDWKLKSDFLLSDNAGSAAVDNLSPAEKYDLLVGDTRKSLTHAALGEGGSYYRSAKKVETWMGICHGWAPAAYMLDRANKAVKVMAADGKTMITFFPADIKALGSLLWATNSPDTKFIGGRCNDKDPEKDKNGRVKDQDCFDTNPGAWHLAIVNQVGAKKRSFVIDATYDYEVWNQPVHSYEYTYFNPQSMEPRKTLKAAMVDIKEFKDDKFDKYRSARTKYVVGVSMNMKYVVETTPTQAKTDLPENDALTEVAYEYDLELDEDMNVIGGEWYTNLHPDFLWTPHPDGRAETAADEILDGNGASKKKWDGKSALPREWAEVAPRASEAGSPLATIVEALIKLSRSNLDI